jgi:uncharacterized membrane protein YjfL (UPF0719 family)
MEFLQQPVVATIYWALFGFVIGWVGLVLFDLSTPSYNLRAELAEKNPAAGIVMAGLLFSTGLIIHGAMIYSDTLLSAGIYACIGIVLNIICYHLINLLIPGWNLNKAIDDHNQGAAWFVFGIFVMIGYIISGAIS